MTPMYTTPTFITEVLCLVTYILYNCFKLLLKGLCIDIKAVQVLKKYMIVVMFDT